MQRIIIYEVLNILEDWEESDQGVEISKLNSVHWKNSLAWQLGYQIEVPIFHQKFDLMLNCNVTYSNSPPPLRREEHPLSLIVIGCNLVCPTAQLIILLKLIYWLLGSLRMLGIFVISTWSTSTLLEYVV